MIFNIQTPIRTVVGLWFALVCPGMAYVRLLKIQRRDAELVLAIAFSIAIGVIVSQILLIAGIWSPLLGLLVLIIISAAGGVIQVIKACSRSRYGCQQAESFNKVDEK